MSDAPAPSPLVTFAYLSTATLPLDALQLQRLLISAQRFNAERGVTGLLIYNGGSFMQVLEGPQDAVQDIFEQRIRHSPLHGGIVELLSGRINRRHFPGWSLACKHVPGQPLPDLLAQPPIAQRHWALLDFWLMWEPPPQGRSADALRAHPPGVPRAPETTKPAAAGFADRPAGHAR